MCSSDRRGGGYPWRGGLLIDLPGVRSFGLVTDEGLDAAFPELRGLSEGCRFADCGHESEPECAVREALAAGQVDAERVALWQRIRKSVGDEGEGAG